METPAGHFDQTEVTRPFCLTSISTLMVGQEEPLPGPDNQSKMKRSVVHSMRATVCWLNPKS